MQNIDKYNIWNIFSYLDLKSQISFKLVSNKIYNNVKYNLDEKKNEFVNFFNKNNTERFYCVNDYDNWFLNMTKYGDEESCILFYKKYKYYIKEKYKKLCFHIAIRNYKVYIFKILDKEVKYQV